MNDGCPYLILSVNVVGAGSSTGKSYAVIVLDEQGNASERAQLVIDLWCSSDFSGYVEITNSDNTNAPVYDAATGGNAKGPTWTESIADGTFDNATTQVDYWVQGNGEVAPATISVQLNDGDGPVGSPRTVDVYVVKPTLKEVNFGGDKIMFLKSDDATTDYGSVNDRSLWKDDDGDGNPERNYPVAYQKDSTPQYGCKVGMSLGNIAPTIEISVTGTAPGNTGSLNSATANYSNGEAILDLTQAQGAFPAIACYDRATSKFTMNWKVKVDGGPETQFASTKHQVYVAKGYNTLLGPPRETLYYLACNNVSGDSGVEIADSVYAAFNTREIIPLDPETGQPKSGGSPLEYGGGSSNHLLVSKAEQCGVWSAFFQEVVSVHGINAYRVEVDIDPALVNLGLKGEFTPATFVLKEITIAGDTGIDPEPTRVLGTPDDQGHRHTQSVEWSTHVIAGVGSHYYDPSYGTGPFHGTDLSSTQRLWEDDSIDAIRGSRNPLVGFSHAYWRPQDASIKECNYTHY